MPIMGDKERELVKKELAGLTGPVTLINFTQELECGYCKETSQIITEVAALSEKINSEIHDFVSDRDIVEKFKIEQIPATVVMGAADFGIRFYGIPSGYEFTSLLESIRMVSSGNSGLSPKTKEILARLKKPLNLEVFVTPTWPYCPRAVVLAHKLALESPLVTASMIESTEFPHLAIKYQVMGVPKTVINGSLHIEGAVPEIMLMQQIEQNYL